MAKYPQTEFEMGSPVRTAKVSDPTALKVPEIPRTSAWRRSRPSSPRCPCRASRAAPSLTLVDDPLTGVDERTVRCERIVDAGSQRPRVLPEAVSLVRRVEQPDDKCCELLRRIGDQKMLAISSRARVLVLNGKQLHVFKISLANKRLIIYLAIKI